MSAYLRELAKEFGLQGWIKIVTSPVEQYEWFDALDQLCEAHATLIKDANDELDAEDPEIDDEVLEAHAALLIQSERSLMTRINQKKNMKVGSDERWQDIFRAAAVLLVRRYRAAIRDGLWPPKDETLEDADA